MNLASNPEDIFIITLSVSLILFSLVHHNHYDSKEKTPKWISPDSKYLEDEDRVFVTKGEYE